MAAAGELTRVGVYRRTLPTSGERVWENVRDWEHLPWLHSGSFGSIACEEEGEWGWRARIGLHGGSEILLELVIEDEAPRYVSRTLEGAGAGSEIWTSVDVRSEHETRVEVEFWLRLLSENVSKSQVRALGDVYVNLYTRLWDEDEAMMLRRARELGARASVAEATEDAVLLGNLAQVRARLPLLTEFAGERFRIVEHAGGLVAHAIVCPHRLGPLEDTNVLQGRIVCPWHGYTFDVATGRECSGRRMRLPQAPRVVVDDEGQQVRLTS